MSSRISEAHDVHVSPKMLVTPLMSMRHLKSGSSMMSMCHIKFPLPFGVHVSPKFWGLYDVHVSHNISPTPLVSMCHSNSEGSMMSMCHANSAPLCPFSFPNVKWFHITCHIRCHTRCHMRCHIRCHIRWFIVVIRVLGSPLLCLLEDSVSLMSEFHEVWCPDRIGLVSGCGHFHIDDSKLSPRRGVV